jgi:four helix bundle protein
MNDDTFENLEVWKEAIELAARVYEILRDCRNFGFRDQIQRAAMSVSSNIAEGYERHSNPEFIRFLFIAKGSCGEVRSQAFFARRVGLLGDADATALISDAKRLSKRLMCLIEVRREKFA